MPFDPQTSVSDPRFAYEFAYMLNEMFPGNDLAGVNRLMPTAIGEETVPQGYAISDFVPACAIFKGATVTVVLMDGVRTSLQVGGLVLSWIEDRSERRHDGFARVAESVAVTMLERLQAFGALDNNRFILAGHSYGGMCLQALGSRLASERIARSVSVAAFGSPKAGDDRMAVAMQRVDLARYMNVGDNIPHCPPIGEQAPLMHLLLTRHESLSVNQLVQIGTRNPILAVDGTITQGGLPLDGGPWTDLSIANFLISNTAPVALAHRIAEYVRRLSVWVRNNPPVPIRARGAGNAIGNVEPVAEPMLPVGEGTGSRADTIRNNGQIAVNEIPQVMGGVAGQPIQVNPQAALGPQVIPPTGNQTITAYKAKKVGRVWIVYYIEQDRVCLIATGKQQAKRFAARMNSALNSWYAAAATDEGAFEQSAIDAFN